MKCPHCAIHFHDDWDEQTLVRQASYIGWRYRTVICPGCNQTTIDLARFQNSSWREWERIVPRGANRGPVPIQVPENIAADYKEACEVLPLSAKASAALSRRCLQAILRAHGYKERDLAREIDALLEEADHTKAIPSTLRETVDAIRNFGNFSAHPITDVTTLQIIEVEPHEAEWCLDVIEEMFDHFYIKPAQALARRAALNAKLSSANKPPAK